MILGGLQKQTLIDYPGKVACTVFTSGCNFRCPYCYNPDLVLGTASTLSEKEFFSFLEERVNFLDAVVVCGGEPTIHANLPEFLAKIKSLGFKVKLDTNGSNPDMLASLLASELVDFISLDIKAPREKYSKLVGVDFDLEKLSRSMAIIEASNIDYEFRTTVVPTLLNKEDVTKIEQWVGKVKLQNFQNKKTLDPKFEKVVPFSKEQFNEISK